MEIAELNYQLTSFTKQNEIYKSQWKEFQAAEEKMKEEMANLNETIKDKIYQLKFFEEKMVKFKDEVEISEKEMEKISIANMKLEVETKEMRDKYMTMVD